MYENNPLTYDDFSRISSKEVDRRERAGEPYLAARSIGDMDFIYNRVTGATAISGEGLRARLEELKWAIEMSSKIRDPEHACESRIVWYAMPRHEAYAIYELFEGRAGGAS